MKFPSFFEPKLAEFVGALLGDGCIGIYNCRAKNKTKIQHRVKITSHSIDDREYVNYLFDLIKNIFDIEPLIRKKKNEKTIELLIFKKDILNFLVEKLGLKLAPKWKRAKIPEIYINNKLELKVLRGYFDTDGSVVLTNNNNTLYPRLEMKISPAPMQKQFIEILKRNNFHFGAYEIGKGKVRVQLNGKIQLNKWVKKVGFSNSKHIKKSKMVAGDGFEPSTSPE